MPKQNFRIPQIQSYQPAIDSRNTQDVYILDGRNYLFDAKGPKSGFGTRLLAGVSVIEEAGSGAVVQSIEVGNRTYVFTSKGAYLLESDNTWTQVLDLNARFPDVSSPDDKKWTAAYLTKGIYFCHPVYGFYKKQQDLGVITLSPRTQDDIPGLPYEPVAICETNGRLIVQGSKYWGWSGPNSAEDFVPALGGSGFQLIADKVAGNSMTVAGFQNGFVGWTDKGCVVAEYIGGDTVFRFVRSTTQQLPINAFAVKEFPDGTQTICTNQGLFNIENGGEPKPTAPLFSEFIRSFLEHEPGIHIRIDYFRDEDLLFVEVRDWTNFYVRTFVLRVALDKWGFFDPFPGHFGIIKYDTGRGHLGFVDSDGIAHRFVETFNRELADGSFVGLDSWIEFGYIRPPNFTPEVDSLLEMQELTIGGVPALPSWVEPEYVDMGAVEFVEPTCPVYDAVWDNINGIYGINGIPMSPGELLYRVEPTYISGDGVLLSDSVFDNVADPYPIVKSDKKYWDMSGWTFHKFCGAPRNEVGYSDGPEDWLFISAGAGIDTCYTAQATFASNVTTADLNVSRFELYEFLSNTRSRTMDTWTRTVGGTIPTLVDDEGDFIADVCPCGVTMYFEVAWNDGVSGGRLLTLRRGDLTENEFYLDMDSYHHIQLTDKNGNIDLEADSGLEVNPAYVKVGITLNRVISAGMGEYAISIGGSDAVTVMAAESVMSSLYEQALEALLGVDPSDSSWIEATLRKFEFMNAITPAELKILTTP